MADNKQRALPSTNFKADFDVKTFDWRHEDTSELSNEQLRELILSMSDDEQEEFRDIMQKRYDAAVAKAAESRKKADASHARAEEARRRAEASRKRYEIIRDTNRSFGIS